MPPWGPILDLVAKPFVAAAGWAWDTVIGGITDWLANGFVQLVSFVWTVMDRSSSPRLTSEWFSESVGAPYATAVAVAAGLLAIFLFCAVIQGVLMGRPFELVKRMAFDTPAAVAGILFTVGFTQFGVDLVDALSDGIWQLTRANAVDAVDGLLLTATKLSPTSFLAPLLLLIGMLGMLMLWVVLYVREALIYLVVALAPMAWAASVWPAIAAVRRRTLVRAGLFGSMPAAQVVVLGVGCAVSFIGILLRWLPWALLPALIAAFVGFSRVGGWPLYELIPLRIAELVARRRGTDRWFRPVPLLPPAGKRRDQLPPPMAGLRLLEVDASWVVVPGRLAGVAVVHDTTAGLVTAVLRVSGDGQFSLATPCEQDARIAGWGDALAAFCRERPMVSRVVWQEWSTSAPIEAELLDSESTPGPISDAAAEYRELLTTSAPRSVAHETLLSISVDLAALPARRSGRVDALTGAVQGLVEELRLLTARLDAAGLQTAPPLSPAELTIAMRGRSTPFVEAQSSALKSSLAAGLGVTVGDLTPMAVAEEWDHVRVDRTVHRSWWVEGWPRLDVPAAWMDLLLLGGSCTRTVTVVFEPIAPSRAARAVDEAAVALESAESAKSKRGFRVRVSDRRAREEVDRREHELVAGYGDFGYCGLVTVSARSLDELDDAAADFEQSAGHAGVQLRPLEGRHGAGWVAALPLGRTVATGRCR